jgi:ribulose-phosphate 3-epimerase
VSTTSGCDKFAELRAAVPVVVPSMLLCDFGCLGVEVTRLEEAGATALHLDVMDGHFVDNLTYGLTLVETFRRITSLPLDVHLMIENPERFIARYRRAGADLLTVHAEAVREPAAVLRQIRALGALAGLAVNPATPIESIRPALEDCDVVLVMSVHPGFGGQAFNPVALEKLRWLRKHAAADMLLEVDGGVNAETIGRCVLAGADVLVAGSAVFGTGGDDGARFTRLATLAAESA